MPTKTYTMLDNGGLPFVAHVTPKKVDVWSQVYTEADQSWTPRTKIVQTDYTQLFVGDNLLKTPGALRKGGHPGNSILIETAPGQYVYAGHEVYSFETKGKEAIVKYFSPVGNSSVPYPYAVGETHTYFMLDKMTVPNDLLDPKKDGYGQFYGFLAKDEANKKAIDKAKKRFKVKVIHKSLS